MKIWRGYVHPHTHPHTQLKKLGIPHTHTHTQSMRGFPVKTGTGSGNTHGDGFICHLYLRSSCTWLYQFFASSLLVPTISPWIDEANILNLNWWEVNWWAKIHREIWKSFCIQDTQYSKNTTKQEHASIHTYHICICFPYH